MVKSEEQKRAVKLSPEFQRCTYEEQQGQLFVYIFLKNDNLLFLLFAKKKSTVCLHFLGKRLANVCELSRHQAASLDDIVMELELPTDLTRIPILQR